MRQDAWFAPWLGRIDPRIVDALMAVTLFAVTATVITEVHFDQYRNADVVAYLLAGVGTLPLLLRRRLPVAVQALTSLAYIDYLALGYQPTALLWGPVLAFYTVAALRRGWIVAICALILVGMLAYSAYRDLAFTPEIAAAQALVITAVAWTFGSATRKLAERNGQLAEATEALRREQQARTERAVTEERLRIARELHDVVAHHMSVISVQSGLAGYVFESDPRTAREAMDNVAETTREALEEMRRMLMVLRTGPETPDGGGDAPFGMAGLEVLAERVRQAGLPVEITTAGTPRPLPPGVELCAYRVVQEALTNTLKHAGRCRAEVFVQYQQNRLTARISDTGTGPAEPNRDGHGLVGMRERARLYGGVVVAGPGRAGGFEVELTLPIGQP
jgi:signal transduction histidine kinase